MGIQDRDYYRQHHDKIAAGHGGFLKHPQHAAKPRRKGLHWGWIALGWVGFLGLCYLGALLYLRYYPVPVHFKSLGRYLT